MTARTCTDRQCGNNPNRRVNPNDYDSAMGFLCDACEDAAVSSTGNPRDLCINCGEYREYHDGVGTDCGNFEAEDDDRVCCDTIAGEPHRSGCAKAARD